MRLVFEAEETLSSICSIAALWQTTIDASRFVLETTPWADSSQATPMADFVKMQRFDKRLNRTAKAFLSTNTLRLILNNVNPKDMYGRRTTCISNYCKEVLNQMWLGDDLPWLEISDAVPDNIVVLLAKHPSVNIDWPKDVVAALKEYVAVMKVG